MQYKINRLLNGLRVLTVPMPQSESATLTVWVKTGSRNENKKVGGISHFFEISEVVDSIGGEFNAATSKDWTNFYIKTRNANLDVAFDVLSDMVLNPILKEEEIKREKGTILQEIAMYEDTPVAKIGDVFEELAFEGNSLGWDTAGTADSVKRIIKNDFLSYRKLYYYPENMLVTLSGGISGKKSLELARRYFEKNLLTHLGSELGLSRGGLFESVQDKPQVKIKTKQTDQCHFILGFMGDGRNYKNRYAQGVLATILHRVFWRQF